MQDDEILKYLTHEEKDVILFFEETIDSLEDDFEELDLCDSGVHCHSLRSLEEGASSHSEPEDVIDLVQPGPAAGEHESRPEGTEAAGEQEAHKPRGHFLPSRSPGLAAMEARGGRTRDS